MRDEDFFLLQPAAVELLLDLLGPHQGQELLIVASDEELATSARWRQHEVTFVPLLDGASEALARVVQLDSHDGVIIVPPFGSANEAVRSVNWGATPTEWRAIRPRSIEEHFLGICAARVRPEGRLVALVPTGLLSSDQRHATRQALLDAGLVLVAALPNDAFWRSRHPIATNLLVLDRRRASGSVAFVDLEAQTSLPAKDLWEKWLLSELVPEFEGPQSIVATADLDESVRLDPQFYNPVYLRLQAPEGYLARTLAELGEINAGISLEAAQRYTERPGEGAVPYVQVRHVRTDGTIAPTHFWTDGAMAAAHAQRIARPGDILITTVGTLGKIAQIDPGRASGVLYDTSIRRLHLREPALSGEVAAFLRSPLGQMQIQRLGGGTVIPNLTSSQLGQLRVFLQAIQPEPPRSAHEPVPPAAPPTPPNVEKTQAQSLVVALQKTMKLLEREDDQVDWRQHVAASLRQLADDLVPKSLESIIRDEFPSPIAIAYRRYMMSRHNPYEHLHRLITLVESCVYFAFHVLLADFCRNQWHGRLTLGPDAKRVLKGDSFLQNRLKFIAEVLAAAEQQSFSLFMPELAKCEIVTYGDRVRDDLRNQVAHTAPGSEVYVRSLIHEFHPHLQEMLERLKFLRGYTLCRIRNHYFQSGGWRYQAEVYRGAEYDVNIMDSSLDEALGAGRLIAAEREHLVLLDSGGEHLDLWPFYQLVFSNETFGEPHLCFYKRRQDQRLYGESIRSSIEIELSGADDFERLVRPPPVTAQK